jgi:hypothetical protein
MALGLAGLLALLLGTNAWATGEFEPNDTRDTARGPLAGGTDYTATFETNNDVDWYVFYIREYSQMDFSATTVGAASCGEAHLALHDKDGKEIEYFHAGDLNEIEHLKTTLTAGRYYFEISNHGCVGDGYRFRIDPAAAITTNRECGEAIVAKDALGPQLAEVSGKLTKNGEALAKVDATFSEASATLSALNQRWIKTRDRVKAALLKLSRNHSLTGYQKRRKRQSLVATKRRASRTLQTQKGPAQRELANAKAKRDSVVAERTGLQTLEAQQKSALSQAESQIAISC